MNDTRWRKPDSILNSPFDSETLTVFGTFTRILLILVVALAAHGVALGARALGRRLLRTRAASQAKVLTVSGFVTSILVFVVYFVAIGFALREFGISLKAYLASASIIGLAVSFGSQGLVQDAITGLTLVFSDLIDVGDMVEIGGQVGIVETVGIRFTTLMDFSGAWVYVPNRTIATVLSYPSGYVRAFLDARLPEDPSLKEPAVTRVSALAQAAYDQLPGILLAPPTVEGVERKDDCFSYLRVKFRIWPGQGAVVEGFVRASVVAALRELDPSYADWMVLVHYRAEPRSDDPDRRLPRPAALRGRSRSHGANTRQ